MSDDVATRKRESVRVRDSISDWEIVSSTLKEFGDFAWLHANKQADDCLRRNDMPGYETWVRVQATIMEVSKLEIDEN